MTKKMLSVIAIGAIAIMVYYTAFNPFPTSAATAGIVAAVDTTPANGGSSCTDDGTGKVFTITTGSGTATITGDVTGGVITAFDATPTAGGSDYTTGTKPVTGDGCTDAEVTILTVSANDSVTVNGRVTAGISISASTPTLDIGDIDGFNGGFGSGLVTWTVKTNNATGYTMQISKDQTFQTNGGGAGKEFSDLTGTPIYGSDPGVAANSTGFGFALHALAGPTADSALLDNGSACGSGTFHADQCWDNIPTGTNSLVAAKDTKADDAGDTAMVTIRADIGVTPTTSFLEMGNYTDVVTMTATMQ